MPTISGDFTTMQTMTTTDIPASAGKNPAARAADDAATTVQVGRSRVHLIHQGAGEPVLFLHGNPDSSEVWSEVIADLRAHHRCIAPDLPGFGHSTAPADFDCSLQGMAAFVDGLVDALGIAQPIHLVVHDFGGPFGLAWAVTHPHKVRSLVIMNTVFASDYRWHLFGRLWRLPVIGELVQALTTAGGFAREMRRGSRKLTRAQIARTYALITPATKRMVLRLYRATDPSNFAGWEDRLRQLTARVPSLVLWAEHDPYIGRHHATRFGTAAVEYVPDSGHWLPAEEPRLVAQRLLRFYAEAAARAT